MYLGPISILLLRSIRLCLFVHVSPRGLRYASETEGNHWAWRLAEAPGEWSATTLTRSGQPVTLSLSHGPFTPPLPPSVLPKGLKCQLGGLGGLARRTVEKGVDSTV
ncbi:hypothetical protein DPEC_G00321610 [Dallia pectoralis]|uniref:Uncharacterized protein n=1 Tax=Dallia pectoralis TaxID=75939 RepID=A0ACC2FAD2_DALPE|nr:hypothetical protein DPEC_G00321610 [Dallia pectoralis]